jgi:serine/threonine-protein kinase RsbW
MCARGWLRLVGTETAQCPEGTVFERSYPGLKDQARQVRKDLAPVVEGCPFADDLILLASELSANAIVHSRSGLPGGAFTVRVEVRAGTSACLQVEDQGGPWVDREPDEERGRGLAMVAALAGDGKWAIEAGQAPGSRVVWIQLDADGPVPGAGSSVLPPAQLGNTQRKDDDMLAAHCACGFTEFADEEITDHLHLAFEPDDLKGNDGQVHEERDRLTCACGFSAITSEELDAHFLKVFTPDDAIGSDGRKHEPTEDPHGA